jgi:hypothetical protein
VTPQYACTVEPCDVLKVKNAVVKFVYCVTESTFGVLSPFKDTMFVLLNVLFAAVP